MEFPNISHEDVSRVAHAIWESEGRPEGRDHEHWMQAKQLLAEGRAAELYPDAAPAADPDARSVQPGFKDAAPGIVPEMKEDPGPELREEPGGRFAKQIASAPETRAAAGTRRK